MLNFNLPFKFDYAGGNFSLCDWLNVGFIDTALY